jgi:hypothetical protein
MDFPLLTMIGHVQYANSTNQIDVYASYTDVWLFQGPTPIGLVATRAGDELPKAPVPMNFTAAVPPASTFQIPSVCFPLFGTSMPLIQKRMPMAVPTFPIAFTMYFVAPSFRTAEIVYYVDSINQLFRIDYPGYVYIQQGNIRYNFLTDNLVKPPICQYFTTTDKLIRLPIFSRRVANVTVDGVSAGVWQGVSDPNSLPVFNEYWYFNPLDGNPLFFLDSNYLGAKVTRFENFISNPGIFNDIPVDCESLDGAPQKQMMINKNMQERKQMREREFYGMRNLQNAF